MGKIAKKDSKLSAHEREAPHSHLIQGIFPVIFIFVSLMDSVFLNWTTQLNDIVPFLYRFILFSIFLTLAFFLIRLSHTAIFNKDHASEELITEGIFKYVRNPMYLGVFFIYIAFIFFSISLLSVIVFVGIIFTYNWMVKYEEQILEELFGDKFRKYKETTPRWIPQLFSSKFH